MDISTILTVSIAGYVLGSLPFGLLLTHFAGLGDVRKIGSGNIGATNVLRTGNKALAAATLALDILKGFIAVIGCAYIWGEGYGEIAGLTAFCGHLFPVWLSFKGGKGVATYIGVLLGIYWQLAIIFCLIWITTAYLTRISSLSALTAAFIIPIILVVQSLMGNSWLTSIIILIMSVLVYIKHHANISRLIQGEEPRIGAGK